MKRYLLVLAVLGLVACGDDDPVATNNTNNSTSNNSNNSTSNNSNNSTSNNSTSNNSNNSTSNNANNSNNSNNGMQCEPAPTDYSPGADDTWDACISDDGTYHAFEASISSGARVAAFETIADLLWRNGTPDSTAFTDAYDAFAPGEGLLSRVSRREDEHYAPVMANGVAASCSDQGVAEANPERCVGPGQMLPLLTTAFEQGILGNDPEINAAVIEATLLWFFHISSFKEGTTCTSVKKDCDSSYAYYTGDQPISGGIGLAGYLRTTAPQAHERVWDGILAVRCWRDLDSADVATNLTLRDQALAQMDAAMLYGVAKVVIARLELMQSQTGVAREASARFVQILGGSLVREASERDATFGAALETALATTNFDIPTVIASLEAVFPCP
ncbi:MAG: hypothetical protein R3E66_08420 [bacterium]